MIINAQNNVLGRLATRLVGRLKESEEDIHVVNANDVIVKGRPDDIMEKYRAKYNAGDRDHGPDYPKRADRIVRRTVRGMLPKNKEGEAMLRRLKVHREHPNAFEEAEDGGAEVESLKGSNFLRMHEIAEQLG